MATFYRKALLFLCCSVVVSVVAAAASTSFPHLVRNARQYHVSIEEETQPSLDKGEDKQRKTNTLSTNVHERRRDARTSAERQGDRILFWSESGDEVAQDEDSNPCISGGNETTKNQTRLLFGTEEEVDDDPFASDPCSAATEGDPFASTTAEATAEEDDGEKSWDDYPWDVTITISRVTASLSVFGSAWIISEVLSDRKKRRLAYHRIVLGLSIFDLFSSFFFFIGVWVNSGERGIVHSGKAQARKWCEVSGFFIYLGSICIPLYNAALAIYFWLTIKRRWTEYRVTKSFERYLHFVVPGVALIPSIAAIPLDLYNPWFNYCFTTHSKNWATGIERGTAEASIIFLSLFWATVFASALVVAISMASIYINVRSAQKRVSRYNFVVEEAVDSGSGGISGNSEMVQEQGNSSPSSTTSPTGLLSKRTLSNIFKFSSVTGTDQNREKGGSDEQLDGSSNTADPSNNSNNYKQNRKRISIHKNQRNGQTRRVRTMAILYTLPFCATWVVPCIFQIMLHIAWTPEREGLTDSSWLNPRSSFVVNTYIATVLPLQGFFNWFIYMLPRFQRLRKENPSCGALPKVLCGVLTRMFQRKRRGGGEANLSSSTRNDEGNTPPKEDGQQLQDKEDDKVEDMALQQYLEGGDDDCSVVDFVDTENDVQGDIFDGEESMMGFMLHSHIYSMENMINNDGANEASRNGNEDIAVNSTIRCHDEEGFSSQDTTDEEIGATAMMEYPTEED